MGCLVRTHRTLLLAVVAIILIFEETRANQLEIAKKYGKRFGTKNKPNNTAIDSKDIEKIATKAASEITKILTRSPVTETTDAPVITRQTRYSHSKPQTTTTSSTTTTPVPTTTSKTDDDQEEVDVDLSQLQVSLPNVKFDCGSRAEGYYGDPDYRCEVFHYCNANGKRDTFLCPSNSKFNQKDMTCDTDALEDLCLPEPAWGQNHLYPTQSAPPLSHVSPIELNKNTNKDKVQIEVTAPKYETKENGFREPVYDMKSKDDPKRTQTNTNPINNNNGNEGNTNTNNNYSNNKLRDNYNNNNNDENSNNGNKEVKFNYFGGSFGERQRNNGALGSSDSSATVGSAGPNDHNSRKNSQTNGNNNNNNNFKNHLLSPDFGTVSDANKKGYNKEENGNTNRVTTSPRQSPVVVTLSTTTDSEHYRSKQQSYTSNNYPIHKPVIQSLDFNSVRNNNNRITYESIHSEQYVPSTAPDKSYLLPPPITTESPSSAPPNKIYTNVRHSPIHTLSPSISSRPAVKWPTKQSTDFYVTERVRFEMTTLPPPPPPPTAPPRQYKPAKEEFAQKPIELHTSVWQDREYNGNYEPTKYMPVHSQQSPPPAVPVGPSKHIQSEQIEISHPKWSPVGQTVHTFGRVNNQNFRPNNRPTKAPHNSWNKIEPQQQPQQQPQQPPQQQLQQQPETDPYLQNNEKPYNYPAIHHTVGPSDSVDNHLWSSDDRQTHQTEVDYSPKNRNNYNSQSLAPLKPKWAQDMMSDMDQMPQMQTMTDLTQQLMPESPQQQKHQNLRTGHKNKNYSTNRKAVQLSESDIFGTQPAFSGFDMTLTDYFNMKPSKPLSKTPMNVFYDQFKPYSFAENSPTEYVKKLTENERQMIKQNNQNEQQIKDNTKTVSKSKSKALNFNPTNEPDYYGSKSKTPTLIEELKMEKDFNNAGKSSGYIPETLPEFLSEEEYPVTMPETHIIPKMHKTKPKGMSAKHHPNRYSPSKKQFISSNLYDELLTGENNWALKHLDTSGLEAAFSNNYPTMPSFPRPKKVPKIAKTSYTTSMVSHMTPPNRFILGAPLPPRPAMQAPAHMHQQQPAFYMPQPMGFPTQLQAQQTMPFPFYMPYFPTPQQSMISTAFMKPPKNIIKQSKRKSNNSPKIFKF